MSSVIMGGIAAAAALALGACGSSSRDEATTKAPAAKVSTAKDFDPANFTQPTRVDNTWLPLTPGMEFTWTGSANRGRGQRPHRVVFTVTDLVKVVNGVRTRVLLDKDFNAGEIQEAEITFHAQDDDGNVWNFGEYPEEYEHGKFTGAPDTWLAGLAGARAGIAMRADPRPNTSSYLQGIAPAIDFADRAKVLRTGLKDCVPAGCYNRVLLIDEWTPAEPGAHQRKYYAPGVGNVRVGPAGGEEAEALHLVKVARLTPAQIDSAREQALKLERRAYVSRKALYGRTPPAEQER